MKKALRILSCACWITASICSQAAAQTETTASQDSGAPKKESLTKKFVEAMTPSSSASLAQDRAAALAREGRYEEALDLLARLYRPEDKNHNIARDYAAVLSWAGQDQNAINVYQNLPPDPEPDYVLAAIGHSYRKLGQTDQALAIYRQGLQKYPANVAFSEGIIRCLIDKNDLDTALSATNNDLVLHGNRPEIAADKEEIQEKIIRNDQQTAAELGRQKQYAAALSILERLYAQHKDHPDITRDYLAILGWEGGHDAQVVELYKTLPNGSQPDYVLKAVGHSYRKLRQPAEALQIYQAGLEQYPDNAVFAEGVIRSLADQGRLKEALVTANTDIRAHGNRPEITEIRKNILRLQAQGSSRNSALSPANNYQRD